MNRFKKAIRLFAFVCLIVLASVGVGLSGGVPLPSFGSKRKSEKEDIELIENQEANSISQKGEVKG